MSKTRRVLLTLLVLAAVRYPLDHLLAAMLPDVSVDPVPQCIAAALLSLLLLGLPAWLLHPWTSPRMVRGRSLLPGLVMAAVAALLARMAFTPLDSAWQSWLNLVPETWPVPDRLGMAMLYVAGLAVIPALTEEAFFRGALLTGLLDGSRRITAVLLSAVSFTLMHGSLANVPSLLLLSLLLTLLMLHSGSLAVPVLGHLVYNLTALQMGNIPGWGSLLSGALLIGLTVLLCVRQPKVAHPPMQWQDGLIAAATIGVLAAAYFV